jgi:hypothetical protein
MFRITGYGGLPEINVSNSTVCGNVATANSVFDWIYVQDSSGYSRFNMDGGYKPSGGWFNNAVVNITSSVQSCGMALVASNLDNTTQMHY